MKNIFNLPWVAQHHGANIIVNIRNVENSDMAKIIDNALHNYGILPHGKETEFSNSIVIFQTAPERLERGIPVMAENALILAGETPTKHQIKKQANLIFDQIIDYVFPTQEDYRKAFDNEALITEVDEDIDTEGNEEKELATVENERPVENGEEEYIELKKRGRKAKEITWPKTPFTVKDIAHQISMTVPAAFLRIQKVLGSELRIVGHANSTGRGRKSFLYQSLEA